MKKLTVTTEQGRSITIGWEAPYILSGFEGYGEVPAEWQTSKSVNQDGMTYVDCTLGVRPLPLVVSIEGENEEDLITRRQEFSTIFNPKNGTLHVEYEDEDGIKEIDVKAESVPKYPKGADRVDGVYQMALVELTAPNPYWRKTEVVDKPLYAWIPKHRFPSVLGVEGELVQTDFAGKIAGDMLSNPNRYRNRVGATTTAPNNFTTELSQTSYDYIEVLGDDLKSGPSAGGAGNFLMVLFSFDVLAMLEKEFGETVWEGAGTIPDMINIAKTKTKQLRYNWHGYGNGNGGYLANMYIWNHTSQSWILWGSHSASVITLLSGYSIDTYATNTPANVIDDVGQVHVMITTNPSDGNINSNVYTDYVEMLLTTKNILIPKTVFGVKGGAESIENTGSTSAPVIITITGYSDTPTIRNLTTDEYITINTIVQRNERIEISTDDNELSIDYVHEDGTREDIYYRMDLGSTLWQLQEGENVLEYTAISQDEFSTVSISYQELYIGI